MTEYLCCLHHIASTAFVHNQRGQYANDVTIRNDNGNNSESRHCEIKAACKKKNPRFFNVRNRAFYDNYDVVAESMSPCEIELPFLPKIISCNHPFDYSDLL